MEVKCKGICVLDKERIRCIGCGRTIQEIIAKGEKYKDSPGATNDKIQ